MFPDSIITVLCLFYCVDITLGASDFAGNGLKRADIHSETILGVPVIHTMITFGNTAMIHLRKKKYTEIAM